MYSASVQLYRSQAVTQQAYGFMVYGLWVRAYNSVVNAKNPDIWPDELSGELQLC